MAPKIIKVRGSSSTITNTQADEETKRRSDGIPVQNIMRSISTYYSEYLKKNTNHVVYFCDNFDYHHIQEFDKRWGCGYRNTQMLFSFLLKSPLFREHLHHMGISAVPTVRDIQRLIERSWDLGFDPKGKDFYRGKIMGTSKLIGATEIWCLLRSLRIPIMMAQTRSQSTELVPWVIRYFDSRVQSVRPLNPLGLDSLPSVETDGSPLLPPSPPPPPPSSSSMSPPPSSSSSSSSSSDTPSTKIISPLFFQFEGHSKTIVGVEQTPSTTYLIIVDPSSVTQYTHLPSVRPSVASLRHDQKRLGQYGENAQVLYVNGEYILTEEEAHASHLPQTNLMKT